MNITVDHLFFTYPSGVKALQDISMIVAQGELVAIVGQNGAGKTTLVKHFNGLLQPTAGSVMVGDLDTRKTTVSKLSAQVGYVFQNPDEQLFCRTVEEEVSFGPRNLGLPTSRIQSLVADALKITELSDKKNMNPYDLSQVWRKMVALASVIAMDTSIVVFDEPTTGQDAINIARIGAVIAKLHERGKTVITITHDIDFCAENFTRVIAMANGQVLLDGPGKDVFSQESLLASTYVDPPQLTRLGKRLGLPETVQNQAEFISAYRQFRNKGA